VGKTKDIQLGDGTRLAILYEDRAVLAIDKPAGWMLAPVEWDRTGRNLQRALESAIHAGAFWARSRNLKYLRFIHRLDAETSGVLLMAKSPGALRIFSRLFESRQMDKLYLAVVQGTSEQTEWTCSLAIGRDPQRTGRMKVNGVEAREALTRFRVLQAGQGNSLVLAQPLTGRTHQIRVHLAAGRHPVLGDPLYGAAGAGALEANSPYLALRAAQLRYQDPFGKRVVAIRAPGTGFVQDHGFMNFKESDLL
jgi:RluA family pseudouridine synthase